MSNSIDISNNNVEIFVQNIFNNLINNDNETNTYNISSVDRILFNNFVNNNDSSPPSTSPFNIDNLYQNNIPSNLDSVLESSFHSDTTYKNVTSDEEIENLKNLKYEDSSKKNNKCPIFFSEFNDEDEVTELPCNHIFTTEAIKKWLSEESNECPVCRYSLNSKEIKNENDDHSSSPRRRREINTQFPNLYHNPMQRYLIEQIINSTNTNENINEDDSEFQQAIIDSMEENNNHN